MTRYIFVTFHDIEIRAKTRGPDYVSDLRKRAHVIDLGGLYFKENVYFELLTKYGGNTVVPEIRRRSARNYKIDIKPRVKAPSAIKAPIPREQWPRSVRLLERLASPSDKGIGDTIARLTGAVGGDIFKKWYKRIMKSDCGCGDRQARLNRLFPLHN